MKWINVFGIGIVAASILTATLSIPVKAQECVTQDVAIEIITSLYPESEVVYKDNQVVVFSDESKPTDLVVEFYAGCASAITEQEKSLI